jgi:hypothetical protein
MNIHVQIQKISYSCSLQKHLCESFIVSQNNIISVKATKVL